MSKMGWFKDLTRSLSKTSSQLSANLKSIFSGKTVTPETLDQLEDLLVMSDIGLETAQECIAYLKKQKWTETEVENKTIRIFLGQYLYQKLQPFEKQLPTLFSSQPTVILLVGVNGSGKTTSIAKLCHFYQTKQHKVALVAGDTFRAAAIEQLEVWSQRTQSIFYQKPYGSDAGSLCYESYQKASAEQVNTLLVDTAGRLHTNKNLMDELSKINRVFKKINPELPHLTLITIDGTTGQNALQQIKLFGEAIPLDGIISTKLDGTAKAGILIQAATRFCLPIYGVGVGEKLEDFAPFSAQNFCAALLDINPEDILLEKIK